MPQLCAGLKHMHSFEPAYAHNDIKPGNVLITHRKGQPPLAILMDFGSARPARKQIHSRSEALQLQVYLFYHLHFLHICALFFFFFFFRVTANCFSVSNTPSSNICLYVFLTFNDLCMLIALFEKVLNQCMRIDLRSGSSPISKF